MEILKYEVIGNTVSCGFKENNYVVYAQTGVKEGYTKTKYLQEMYQEIKHALDYERKMFNLGKPNSIITEEVGDVWSPESPKVSKVIMSIDKYSVQFEATNNNIVLTMYCKAYDQYGDEVRRDPVYASDYGSVINNLLDLPSVAESQTINVTATVDGVSDVKQVELLPYKEIVPIEKPVSEIDISTAKVAELEAQISLLVG